MEDASWTVRWSIQGQAPFFYNTRTQKGTWLEPAEAEGLLTATRLKRAKEAALQAEAEGSEQ